MNKLEQLELAKAKDYLTMEDVALVSNLSKSTIRTNVKDGRLKSLQKEKSYRILFKMEDVISWVEGGIYG